MFFSLPPGFPIAMVMSFFFYLTASSQNLVPNPGFEEMNDCPNGFHPNIQKILPGWYSPTKGTPDYFNKCNKGEAGVPRNVLGKKAAHSGIAYVGIVIVGDLKSQTIKPSYREYLGAKLIQPLEKGKRYCVKAFLATPDVSGITTDAFGFMLSTRKISSGTKKNLDLVPQVANPGGKYIESKTTWMPICGEYIAQGGEQYLYIGNFNDVAHTKTKQIDLPKRKRAMAKPFAYCFIDDVSLELMQDDICECPQELQDTAVNIPVATTVEDTLLGKLLGGEKIVLHNIFFKTDAWELDTASSAELNGLVELLRDHPGFKIHITGHTDSSGKEKQNMALSANRAKAVKNYLVSHGIAESRISSMGMGSEFPVGNNDTPEGRSLNRRVEFELANQFK